MVLLCSPTIFEKYLSKSIDKCKGDIISIFNNSNVKFLITKELLFEIEKNVSDLNIFQGLIKYLFDTNQIEKENIKKVSEESVYLSIMEQSKIHNLFLFTLENSEFDTISKRFVYSLIKPKNSHWVLNNILTNKNISLSCHDFKNNIEIDSFFKLVFSIPNYIKKVKVYNRESDTKFIESLKGKNIDFYSFLDSPTRNKHRYYEIQREMKRILGGKLKLFVTSDKRIIHERKIFIDNICITIDNSFKNLLIEEPTWTVLIEFNPELEFKWSQKCSKFINFLD